MKILTASFLALVILASCATGGSGRITPKSGRIVVRDSDFDLVATIHATDDLGFVVASMRNANRIGDTSTISHRYSHKIDLDDRWLYDTKTGHLVLLTMPTTSVYRIRDEDRNRFDSLIQK
jgi:hypothetical protein